MKFKIGDVVVLKDTKQFRENVVSSRYIGKEGTICKIEFGMYEVHGYMWIEDSLELVVDPNNWIVQKEPNSIDDILRYLNTRRQCLSTHNTIPWIGTSNFYGIENGEPVNFNFLPKNLDLITPEQFYKYILKQENSMPKKVIGYKAPYDLFKGKVPKGSIFEISTREDSTYYVQTILAGGYFLPKEIVEKWEPVYEEISKVITIGKPFKAVRISRGKIECAGKEIPHLSIKNIYKQFLEFEIGYILDWKISIPNIEIGCSTFTKEEIKQVLDIYENLNN